MFSNFKLIVISLLFRPLRRETPLKKMPGPKSSTDKKDKKAPQSKQEKNAGKSATQKKEEQKAHKAAKEEKKKAR